MCSGLHRLAKPVRVPVADLSFGLSYSLECREVYRDEQCGKDIIV
jgi:hypothetical protein